MLPKALTGFSHVCHPVSVIQLVSMSYFCLKALSLGQLLGVGKESRTYIPRTAEREEAFFFLMFQNKFLLNYYKGNKNLNKHKKALV